MIIEDWKKQKQIGLFTRRAAALKSDWLESPACWAGHVAARTRLDRPWRCMPRLGAHARA